MSLVNKICKQLHNHATSTTDNEHLKLRHKHSAAIFQKGTMNILATGYNYIDCIMQNPVREPTRLTVHAECAAINGYQSLVGTKIKSSKICILIIQVHIHTGDLKMSKPCKNCETAIKKLGIKHVYYSTSDGSILYEKYA